MMEVIEQDPKDLPEIPEYTSSGVVWKLLTGVFLITTIIFVIVSFTKGGDANCSDGSKSGDSNSSKTASGNTSGNASGTSGGSSNAGSSEGSELKDFDVDIPGLVNGAGFGSGSILTIRTNSTGEWMVGEVSSNNKVGYAYRSLPSGKWQHANFGEGAKCKDITRDEMDAFNGVTVKNPDFLKCSADSSSSTGNTTTSSSIVYTIKEALDKGIYKDAE
jgi:hypothetical protein